MTSLGSEKNLLPHHGEVYYFESVFTSNESNGLFKALLDETPWRHEPIKIFGREVMQPRLTAWYANMGISYSYSGITMQGLEWTETLSLIKSRVEERLDESFNSVLINLYRNGNDSMGWHRDNEKELGVHPLIASLSFGASRKFQLRTYREKSNRVDIELQAGSLLVMGGESQPFWEHCVPKTKTQVGPRINLTFRKVIK